MTKNKTKKMPQNVISIIMIDLTVLMRCLKVSFNHFHEIVLDVKAVNEGWPQHRQGGENPGICKSEKVVPEKDLDR